MFYNISMLNYNSTNIKFISFFISLPIFIFIILLINFITPHSNSLDISSTFNQNIESNIITHDIILDEIKYWKIHIDKLNIEAPISEGTDENILENYVGHYSFLNYLYGTVILKSYNIGTHKNFFANLKELSLGDEIYYTINDKTFTYKVTSNHLIDESLLTNTSLKNIEQNLISSAHSNNLILITYVKDMPGKLRCVISSY